MFERILCPIDGSDHARKAEKIAIDLAKTYGAALIFMHGLLRNADADELERFAEIEQLSPVVRPEIARLRAVAGPLDYGFEEPPSGSRALTEIGQSLLNNAKVDAEASGVGSVRTILTDGEIARQILTCIDNEKIDCVVMGSRGLSDVGALVLGSASHKVLSQAPCTCIAVK